MTDARDHWYLRPGIWFLVVIALGAALRFYCVIFTEGTQDVEIWERHARDVREHGLIGYYHGDTSANHPPFISEAESVLLRASDESGVAFRIFLRAPFALLDAGSAFLLLLLLGASPWRFVAAACYWLNPLAIILSACHGNTDCAVAFFLLLALWFISKEKLIPAAIVVGASLWIKLPGVVAIPALIFFIPKWKHRFVFLAVVGVVALVTYLPALIQDAPVVYKNVFGYRAQDLHTIAGVATWGPRVLLFSIIASPARWPQAAHAPILFYLENSWKIALALVVILSCLRRRRRSIVDLGATIAMSYVLVYALNGGFSFQYFAWSLPLWFLLSAWFLIPAAVLTSAYVYALYWYLCGNPWLLGAWDFNGHPYWPSLIVGLRNAAYLFFFTAAVWFAISTTAQAFRVRP